MIFILDKLLDCLEFLSKRIKRVRFRLLSKTGSHYVLSSSSYPDVRRPLSFSDEWVRLQCTLTLKELDLLAAVVSDMHRLYPQNNYWGELLKKLNKARDAVSAFQPSR